MNNISPQVKALGRKQKLCLYHARTIFTEIKILCPPRYTCTSRYCHGELCMSTGGKNRCPGFGRDESRENRSRFVSWASFSRGRAGGWAFRKWDVITKEARSGLPKVTVGTSHIRDSALMQGCHFPAGHEVRAEAPLCFALSKNSYGAGCFSASSQASGGWLRH